MLRKLGAVTAVLAATALSVVLSAQPASADGATTLGIGPMAGNTPGGTVYTCNAAARADWFIDLEADPPVGVLYEASTSCSPAMKLEGTVSVLESGTVLSSRSGIKLLDTLLTLRGGFQMAAPGANLELKYTTKVTSTQPFFTWTTVPAECTVSGKSITCTKSVFFTVA